LKYIKKDRSIRENIFNKQYLYLYNKSLIINKNLPNKVKNKIYIYFNDLKGSEKRTRVTNRCIITGRARGVYKKFRLNRNIIKKLINSKNISSLYTQ
jgi:small subunit ribosomal protein S14